MAFLGKQPFSEYCNEVWDRRNSQRKFGLLFTGTFAEGPFIFICLLFFPVTGIKEEHIGELSPWPSHTDGGGQDSCLYSRVINRHRGSVESPLDIVGIENLQPRELTDFLSGISRVGTYEDGILLFCVCVHKGFP